MRNITLTLFCCLFSALIFGQGTGDSISLLPEHRSARVAQFKKEPVVKDKVVFFGDGVIESGKWRKLLKDSSVINRGITGELTPGLLMRIGDIVARQPASVFLLAGEDDLHKHLQDESIIENIFSIVTKIKRGSKGTRVFVLSLLPVDPSHKSFPAGYDKEEHVLIINAQLTKYAERLGYTYVDMHSELTDAKGHLDARYTTNGLALSPAGYVHFTDILKRKKSL
jgi:lysophospholipase L1-like esterase